MNVQLEGCTLAGAWLTASVRQAFYREDPALVAAEVLADPHSAERAAVSRSSSFRVSGVFAETELGWLSRTGVHRIGKRPRSILVRVEVQGHADRTLWRHLANRVDADLQRRSPAYRYLRERGDLHQPRVTPLKPGTRRIEEERRVRELLGAVWMPEVRVVSD